MFDRFRWRVGLTCARFRYGRGHNPVVRFTDALSKSQKALILLSEDVREPAPLQRVLEFFTTRFAANNLLLVARHEVAASVRVKHHVHLMTFTNDDLTAWFLPRSELLRKLKKSTFDVAVDLNIDVALASAVLCRASEAPLRIGFRKTHADAFYNFQVHTRHSKNVGAAYDGLIHCLQMF